MFSDRSYKVPESTIEIYRNEHISNVHDSPAWCPYPEVHDPDCWRVVATASSISWSIFREKVSIYTIGNEPKKTQGNRGIAGVMVLDSINEFFKQLLCVIIKTADKEIRLWGVELLHEGNAIEDKNVVLGQYTFVARKLQEITNKVGTNHV
jgi:hypothetical protein